jgi:probable HAF family extracellular repeat protein
VGLAFTEPTTRAYLFTGAEAAFLPPLVSGGEAGAFGINESGTVVGGSITSAGDLEAVEWTNRKVAGLGDLPGGHFSQAVGINNAGEVLVESTSEASNESPLHAAVLASGKLTRITVPGETGESFANAINTNGVVVGENNTGAWIYEKGTATNLNTLIPSNSGIKLDNALGINAAGDIVGSATQGESTIGYELVPVS